MDGRIDSNQKMKKEMVLYVYVYVCVRFWMTLFRAFDYLE